MNIKDRLKLIDSLSSAKRTVKKEKIDVKLDHFLDGVYVMTPFGQCFYIEKSFPIGCEHGNVKIESPEKINPQIFKYVGKDEKLAAMDIRKVLFFDTETTGLSGGAGTYIFLAGFGYFKADDFVVRQYFLRDMDEELAFLHAINEFLKDFSGIVSYNGKSFDWPLLQSRFIFSRFEIQLKEPQHLDLVHTARRIWKRRLHDCSLNHIERSVLNFVRGEDIASYLIPYTYFQFLRDKNIEPIIPIFIHNVNDILSLAALLSKTINIFNSPFDFLSEQQDLFSVALTYEKMNHWNKSIDIYEKLLEQSVDHETRYQLSLKLSYCYKHTGMWEQAVKLWHHIIDQRFAGIESYVELAKYYEHHVQDYEKAIELVKRALNSLEIVTQLHGEHHVTISQDDLTFRLERNIRKLNNSSDSIALNDRITGY